MEVKDAWEDEEAAEEEEEEVVEADELLRWSLTKDQVILGCSRAEDEGEEEEEDIGLSKALKSASHKAPKRFCVPSITLRPDEDKEVQ